MQDYIIMYNAIKEYVKGTIVIDGHNPNDYDIDKIVTELLGGELLTQLELILKDEYELKEVI